MIVEVEHLDQVIFNTSHSTSPSTRSTRCVPTASHRRRRSSSGSSGRRRRGSAPTSRNGESRAHLLGRTPDAHPARHEGVQIASSDLLWLDAGQVLRVQQGIDTIGFGPCLLRSLPGEEHPSRVIHPVGLSVDADDAHRGRDVMLSQGPLSPIRVDQDQPPDPQESQLPHHFKDEPLAC